MDLVNLKDYQFSYYLQWKQNKQRSWGFLLEPIQKGERWLPFWVSGLFHNLDRGLFNLWNSFYTICSGRYFVYGLILCQLLQIPFFLFSLLLPSFLSFSLHPLLTLNTKKWLFSVFMALSPAPTPVFFLLPHSKLATRTVDWVNIYPFNSNKLESFPLKLCMFVDILLKVLYVKKVLNDPKNFQQQSSGFWSHSTMYKCQK